MKKSLFFLLIFSLIPLHAFAKVKVVATIPILASLANAVGGERVSVKSLARPNQDPHFLPAKPSYAVALNRADLLIHVGMDLEVGWLPAVLLQSRNPKIQFNSGGDVNASRGIQALEVPTGIVTRAMGDIHPQGNPHYFLDPRNSSIIAKNIYQHLLEVDPEGEAYYQGQLQAFNNKLQKKMALWNTKVKPFKGKKIITYHKAFTYFANWAGLSVVANVEPKPGIPPSSKHVDWLLKFIPENQVTGIFMAPYYPKKVPQYLAKKTGLLLRVIPAQPADNSETAFFQLFEQLIRNVGTVVK